MFGTYGWNNTTRRMERSAAEVERKAREEERLKKAGIPDRIGCRIPIRARE